jgi:cysteine-rich repeat protein
VASLNRMLTLIAAALTLVVQPLYAGAQTVPDDLCVGDPCTISTDVTVDAGSDLDFGARSLVFAERVRVTIGIGDGSGIVAFRAAEITMDPGAKIEGFTMDRANVTLEARVGSILMKSDGSNRSEIDVRAAVLDAGSIELIAINDVNVGGRLTATASGEDAVGGSIQISAGGNVTVSQEVRTDGSGSFAGGGDITIDADGNVLLAEKIFLTGSDFGGGSLYITAFENITVSTLVTNNGGNPDGEAGEFDFQADGDIHITSSGELRGRGGSGADDDCGDGAPTLLDAGGTVLIEGLIDTKGGYQCIGGDVEINAGLDMLQQGNGKIATETGGGFGGAGPVYISAGRDARLLQIDASAAGGFGEILVNAGSLIEATDKLNARATGGDGIGGTINLTACTVNVLAPNGALDTRGPWSFPGFGENTIAVSNPASILSGSFDASTANKIEYLDNPPTPTGSADPAFEITQNPMLMPCANSCGDGELDPGTEACDDGNIQSCDGCRGDCSRVDDFCGDGIVECGEQCDDGNQVDGDGCESDCTPTGQAIDGVLIPSRGNRVGCYGQWKLLLPDPQTSETGRPTDDQQCIDGDFCDQDGAINGECSITSTFCLQVPDTFLTECNPTDPVARMVLKKPLPGTRNPTDNANAQALVDSLSVLGPELYAEGNELSAGAPVAGLELCAPPVDLRVPLNGASGKKKFKIRTIAESGRTMKRGQVRLKCLANTSVCGDGIAEQGELCDDGNLNACDGCYACKPEGCGNGVLDCGEECDDGEINGTAATRCDNTCKIAPTDVRIPGGGSSKTDCLFQWSMDIDEAALEYDSKGRPKKVQMCKDNDPGCDLDPTPGSCRVRVFGCFGGTDPSTPTCTSASVVSQELKKPSARTRKPYEVQARIALEQMFAGVSFATPAGVETCTGGSQLYIPAGKKLTIKNKVFPVSGKKDGDALSILCLP